MPKIQSLPEVLTLEETAKYLRLPKNIIEMQASKGKIPGKLIEDTWRFLKVAIDEWLRSQDSRVILLQQAGALTEDETLSDLRAKIYKKRDRPETED